MSLLSWAEENEAYVDQLTRDQARVMRILRMQRRLKVIGSRPYAGTGNPPATPRQPGRGSAAANTGVPGEDEPAGTPETGRRASYGS